MKRNEELRSGDNMEITGEGYHITYDPATTTISCQGALRLYGAAGYVSLEEFKKSQYSEQQSKSGVYSSLMDLFNKILNQRPATITLNLCELQALNSSGINVLSKFVIKARDQKVSQFIVQGTRQFPWQTKVLNNLQRLMPDIVLEWK